MSENNRPLLEVRDLRTHFPTDDGLVRAVDGVSFRIDRRQTFALVGESGCGKSQTAFSILRILQKPGRVVGGQILLDGTDLGKLTEKQMRQVRGGKISMIFQEPMSSLNPVFKVGQQISEAILLHRRVSSTEARRIGIDMLAKVGIPAPEQRYDEYPHQLSGGMRQRVMIAMALSCNPQLLIADEPTTALDVTIQAQILDLLNELQASEGLSVMLITHDLAVVAETADVVGVMYASTIAELASAETLYNNPLHPYTQGLFRSVPKLGEKRSRLETIAGSVPNPLAFPAGCKFHPRCPLTRSRAASAPEKDTAQLAGTKGDVRVCRRCATDQPPLRETAPGHWVACWLAEGYDDAPETSPAEKPAAAPATSS
jgi:peptide/nickel transport system ATP-binding protein/oligopeptide transport system ATP-binding protein